MISYLRQLIMSLLACVDANAGAPIAGMGLARLGAELIVFCPLALTSMVFWRMKYGLDILAPF
jgi:hypothetical protein